MRAWATANLCRASALSKIPPPPQTFLSKSMAAKQKCLLEILRFRKWEMPVEKEEWMFVSRLLTYPLSISRLLPHCGRGPNTRLLVLGARAEASLPPKLWLESVFAGPRPRRPLHLHFIGPSVTPSPPMQSRQMQLRWTHGVYHNTHTPCHDEIDGIVFFNPGLGSPQHRDNWRQTLEELCKKQQQNCKPLLVTSLSEADAALDAQALCEAGISGVRFELNPFRSQCSEVENGGECYEHANHYISVTCA